MRALLLFFFLCFFSGYVKSQDLVVLANGDSLNCKIEKVRSENFYIRYLVDGTHRNAVLRKNQIKYSQSGFYPKSSEAIKGCPEINRYPYFRLSTFAGWSYRTAKIASGNTPQYNQYLKELKQGYHFGVDGILQLSDFIGIGARVYQYRTLVKKEITITVPMVSGYSSVSVSDDIGILYAGPVFETCIMNSSKTRYLSVGLSLGYMRYKDTGKLGQPATITGSAISSQLELGYHFIFSKKFSSDFRCAFYNGLLTNYDISTNGNTQHVNLETKDYEGLGMLAISLGISYHF